MIINFFDNQQNGILLLSPETKPDDFHGKVDGIKYLMNPDDLLYDENHGSNHVISSDPLIYFQALENNSIECIWISDYLFQVAPIKALFTLKVAVLKLKAGGRIFGRWFDRLPPDPRLISLFSSDYFGLPFFKNMRVNFRDGLFELFKRD